MKNNRCFIGMVAIGLLLLVSGSALAVGGTLPVVNPPADFQTRLNGAETLLSGTLQDTSTTPATDLWHDHGGANGIYRKVNSARLVPGFIGVDNTNNTVNDDDELMMLGALVDGLPTCLAGVTDAKIDAARTAFAHNRGNGVPGGGGIMGQEMCVKASVSILSVTVCTNSNLSLPLGLGTFWVPSLWYQTWDPNNSEYVDAALDSAAPGLKEFARDFTAGYMTTGDTNNMAYCQEFWAQVIIAVIRYMLPNMVGKAAAAKGIPADQVSVTFPDNFGAGGTLEGDKFVCSDIGGNITINVSGQSATVSQADACTTINNFIGQMTCTSGRYTCMAAQLACQPAVGDLNGNGVYNRSTYAQVGAGNRTGWFTKEGILYQTPFVFSVQPIGNIAPDPVVALEWGDTWTFSANVARVYQEPYTFLWKRGAAADSLSPIVPAVTTPTYGPITLGDSNVGTFYYGVDLADGCGSNGIGSNVVGLTVAPPKVTITKQPGAVAADYAKPFTLSLTATTRNGTLAYQWQHNIAGTWTNVGSNQNSFTIGSSVFTDAGDYRCVITNTKWSTTATTSTATVTINVPPVYITTQPKAQNLVDGQDLNLSVAAHFDVPPGGLTYQWYKNNNPIGLNQNTFSIPGAHTTDTGYYKVLVTSVDYPAKFKMSSEIYVSIVGAAFRVDKSSTAATPDGKTWATAFKTIQAGVDAAAAVVGGGEVWVAGGPGGGYVYNETRTRQWGGSGNEFRGSIVMADNVQIYGGFEGLAGRQESIRTQRAVALNRTTIDGAVANSGGPAVHVIVVGGSDLATPMVGVRIDGFTIKGGVATPNTPSRPVYHMYRGGGVYSSLSSVSVANCTFTGNYAEVSGGAVANIGDATHSADSVFTNCVFYGNTANRGIDFLVGGSYSRLRGGGALYTEKGSPIIQYCTIYNNAIGTPSYTTDGELSGGILNGGGSPSLVGAIIWGNPAGGIQEDKLATVTTTATYCDVQPPFSFAGDTSTDIALAPNFVSTTGPAFNLNTGSPCIDHGEPGVPSVTTDLARVPRPQGLQADMGAYESGVAAPTAVCLPVDLELSPDAVVLTPDLVTDPSSTIAGGLCKATVNNVETINYTCADAGSHSVTLKLMDYIGQSSTCVATVNVQDTDPPVAICKDSLTVNLSATGVATVAPADLDNGSSDNCGIKWTDSGASFVTRDDTDPPTPATFTCADATKSIPVTLTIGDGFNQSTCSTSVTVLDARPPTALVRSTVSLFLNAQGTRQVVATDIDNGSSDNCSVTKTVPQRVYGCSDAGQTFPVTLTLQDSTGNTSSATSNVTILDNAKPVVQLKTGFSLYLDFQGNGTLTAFDIDNGTHDNCGIKSMTLSKTNFTCVDLGTKAVTLTVLDQSNNATTLGTFITVRDGGAPNVVLNKLTQPHVAGNNDTPLLWKTGSAYVDPGAVANDACQGVVAVVTDASAVNTSVAGEYPVIYTATDSAGNVGTATRIVQVVDHFPPIITLLGDASMYGECGDPFVDPGVTAVDETGAVLPASAITMDPPEANIHAIVSQTLTYTATDQWNGTAQTSRILTLFDTVAPVITLNGANPYYMLVNTNYAEYGFSADDACVGDISLNVAISGTVDTATVGHYVLSYDVFDHPELPVPHGNAAVTVTRDVYVVDPLTFNPQPQTKYAYIDEGPFQLTTTFAGGALYTVSQWFRDTTGLGTQPVTGPGTLTLTLNPATLGVGAAHSYHVEVTDKFGKHASTVATVQIGNHLVVGHMGDRTGVAGRDLTIPGNVSGGVGPMIYQWMKDDGTKALAPIHDGGNISGTDTATLMFKPFNPVDAGTYALSVSDALTIGSVTNTFTLTEVAGTPLAGGLGLAALAAFTALGGAVAIRRKK